MRDFLRHSVESSNWQTASTRRLRIGILLATLIVAAIIGFLKLPPVAKLSQRIPTPLDLTLVEESVPEPPPETQPEEVLEEERFEEIRIAKDELLEEAEVPQAPEVEDLDSVEVASADTEVSPVVDWQQEKEDAVQRAVDDMESTISVNPNFDEKRRVAAMQFRPSKAPVKKPIWENVEKDKMGRTILRSGSCYRILDDPSGVNRWIFETFEQYLTFCGGSEKEYLIEIDEIPDRYSELETPPEPR